jgi:TraC protein
MKNIIVPAQVTNIEDKVTSSLTMSQIALLTLPVFINLAAYFLIPKPMSISIFKLAFMLLVTGACSAAAVRFKGKILLAWTIIYLRYSLRPKYFVFDKNSSYLRYELTDIKPSFEPDNEAESKPHNLKSIQAFNHFLRYDKELNINFVKNKKEDSVLTFQKDNKSSSRHQIDIKGIKNGVLILPDRRYRAVLSVSSINFELRSDIEQDSVIDNYQSFINSLPCSIQILLRVKEIDLKSYLDSFSAKSNSEGNKVYKEQIVNYCEFVSGLVSSNKILSRKFYIVVTHRSDENADFEAVEEQLKLKLDIITRGLNRLGIKHSRLTNLEILDLFYIFYNPEMSKTQPLNAETLTLLNQAYF